MCTEFDNNDSRSASTVTNRLLSATISMVAPTLPHDAHTVRCAKRSDAERELKRDGKRVNDYSNWVRNFAENFFLIM